MRFLVRAGLSIPMWNNMFCQSFLPSFFLNSIFLDAILQVLLSPTSTTGAVVMCRREGGGGDINNNNDDAGSDPDLQMLLEGAEANEVTFSSLF